MKCPPTKTHLKETIFIKSFLPEIPFCNPPKKKNPIFFTVSTLKRNMFFTELLCGLHWVFYVSVRVFPYTEQQNENLPILSLYTYSLFLLLFLAHISFFLPLFHQIPFFLSFFSASSIFPYFGLLGSSLFLIPLIWKHEKDETGCCFHGVFSLSYV